MHMKMIFRDVNIAMLVILIQQPTYPLMWDNIETLTLSAVVPPQRIGDSHINNIIL